jgi:ATP-dependent protease ClpP protease subunit
MIFSSGYKGKRYIAKNTSIMCHQYSDGIEGKHHDIESRFKEVKLTNARMINVLKENTELDARTIKSKLLNATDVWLTADELIELGIADDYI